MLCNKEHLRPFNYKFLFSDIKDLFDRVRRNHCHYFTSSRVHTKSHLCMSSILLLPFLLNYIILYKEFREFIGFFETKRLNFQINIKWMCLKSHLSRLGESQGCQFTALCQNKYLGSGALICIYVALSPMDWRNLQADICWMFSVEADFSSKILP